MSFYNMICGVNQASFYIFPMLGYGSPDDGSFPRFRDCFVSEDKQHILVLSRMGGGNRECWEDGKKDCDCPACTADMIEDSEGCISRVDDDFDSTYCTFTFKVPEKWKKDFELLIQNKPKETSQEYKKLVIECLKKPENKIAVSQILDYKEAKKNVG